MTFKNYHAAIEIKDIVSYFLRRCVDINLCVMDCEDKNIILKFNEVKDKCNEIMETIEETVKNSPFIR